MQKQVYNPYLPEGLYMPDCEPHVFGGRVYLYGSHDLFGSSRYCAGDYQFWSAPVNDLSAWAKSAYDYSRRGKRNPFGAHCLWAADCTRGTDGRYYLYYCFNFINYICVAVSDAPDGPFRFCGIVRHADGTPYGKGKGDIMCFDPAAFTDDDGQTYIYSGYSANEDLRRMLRMRGIKNVDGTGGQVFRVKRDMLTVDGAPKMLIPGYKNSAGTGFEGHEMYEASSLRKIGKKYYFIYSSRRSHELAYAVSDRPDGGFRYGGAIISNGDIGYRGREEKDALNYWGNIHGSIEKIGEKWYVFYHRQTNKNEQTRQGCAEEITFGPDGSIPQVEMTSCGLNGGPLRGSGKYPAYIACNLMSIGGAVKCAYGPLSRHKYRYHPCITEYARGKQCIAGMRNGAVAGFKYFDCRGCTRIYVTVRGTGGRLLIGLSPEGDYCGEIKLQGSKSWVCCGGDAALPRGKAALYFTYKGAGKIDFLDFTLQPLE